MRCGTLGGCVGGLGAGAPSEGVAAGDDGPIWLDGEGSEAGVGLCIWELEEPLLGQVHGWLRPHVAALFWKWGQDICHAQKWNPVGG